MSQSTVVPSPIETDVYTTFVEEEIGATNVGRTTTMQRKKFRKGKTIWGVAAGIISLLLFGAVLVISNMILTEKSLVSAKIVEYLTTDHPVIQVETDGEKADEMVHVRPSPIDVQNVQRNLEVQESCKKMLIKVNDLIQRFGENKDFPPGTLFLRQGLIHLSEQENMDPVHAGILKSIFSTALDREVMRLETKFTKLEDDKWLKLEGMKKNIDASIGDLIHELKRIPAAKADVVSMEDFLKMSTYTWSELEKKVKKTKHQFDRKMGKFCSTPHLGSVLDDKLILAVHAAVLWEDKKISSAYAQYNKKLSWFGKMIRNNIKKE